MPCKVAIVGACSLVGREILKTLSDRSFPLSQIRLFDGESDMGHKLVFNNQEITVEEVSEHTLREEKFKFIFFAGGSLMSRTFIPIARSSGAVIIDTSSYSYIHEHAPLIIPEINRESIGEHKLLSNPYSLTTQLCYTLSPIKNLSPISRIVISTYQSVSGAGFFGVEELERQIVEIEDGKEASLHYFSKQIAFNVFPQVDHFADDSAWTNEELIVAKEVKEILQIEELALSLTCVRVPVIRGHCASVMVELEKDISLEEIEKSWEENDVIVHRQDFPTPWELEGTIDMGVGRLRKDLHKERCYHYWTVADNLSVGMALNPVTIAEEFL